MVQVYCNVCHEFHDTQEVEFLDIEEDFQGRDLMTFICPYSGETLQSLVVSRG